MFIKSDGCLFLDQGGVDPEDNPGGYHYKSGFGGDSVQHIGTFWACESLLSMALVALGERGKLIIEKIKNFVSGDDQK